MVSTIKLSKKKQRITCANAELMRANLPHDDEEYKDVTCELHCMTTPEKYKQGNGICPAVKWDNIAFACVLSGSRLFPL